MNLETRDTGLQAGQPSLIRITKVLECGYLMTEEISEHYSNKLDGKFFN